MCVKSIDVRLWQFIRSLLILDRAGSVEWWGQEADCSKSSHQKNWMRDGGTVQDTRYSRSFEAYGSCVQRGRVKAWLLKNGCDSCIF